METSTNNPLSKFFRQPTIYLKLPSLGRWWNPGSVEPPGNQELAIYPMTAKDEIMLKTPDALMNGQGMVNVIQSCVPAIKNAWDMPTVDLDAVLISIRLATYGSNMDFETNCTHCGTKNLHGLDLSQPLSQINCPDFEPYVHYKGLKIKLRPQNYRMATEAGVITFEEQRINQTLLDAELPEEEKTARLTASLEKLVDLGIKACSDSTEYIEVDGQRVIERAHINDFYANAESEVIRLLQTRVQELAQEAKIPPYDLECEECHKEYKADLNFDYSSFFGQGF
jgi:hypothetical protein